MSTDYKSVIESIQMIIKNMEENREDCINVVENRTEGLFPVDIEQTKSEIKEIEKDIEEHKEAIIALQMVASGKLRVI